MCDKKIPRNPIVHNPEQNKSVNKSKLIINY